LVHPEYDEPTNRYPAPNSNGSLNGAQVVVSLCGGIGTVNRDIEHDSLAIAIERGADTVAVFAQHSPSTKTLNITGHDADMHDPVMMVALANWIASCANIDAVSMHNFNPHWKTFATETLAQGKRFEAPFLEQGLQWLQEERTRAPQVISTESGTVEPSKTAPSSSSRESLQSAGDDSLDHIDPDWKEYPEPEPTMHDLLSNVFKAQGKTIGESLKTGDLAELERIDGIVTSSAVEMGLKYDPTQTGYATPCPLDVVREEEGEPLCLKIGGLGRSESTSAPTHSPSGLEYGIEGGTSSLWLAAKATPASIGWSLIELHSNDYSDQFNTAHTVHSSTKLSELGKYIEQSNLFRTQTNDERQAPPLPPFMAPTHIGVDLKGLDQERTRE
jgi:hypothetical protein